VVAVALIVVARTTIERRRASSASSAGPSAEGTVVVESLEDGERTEIVVSGAWALTAAVAAGYTALLFKCIAELIAGAAGAPRLLLLRWETYVLVSTALIVAPSELHCLNMALQSGDAVSVIPMYLAMGMLAQLITGGVFFREFRDFRSVADAALFAASVALMLSSVVFMARAQATSVEDVPKVRAEIAPLNISTAAVASGDQAITGRPDLSEALLAEEAEEENLAESSFSRASFMMGVSMSGFGGAIESLDAWRNGSLGRRSITPGRAMVGSTRSRGFRSERPNQEVGYLLRFASL